MSASQDIITTPSTQSRKRSIADWLTPPRSKHENSENSDVEIISETFNPRSPKAKKRKEDIPVIRVLKPIENSPSPTKPAAKKSTQQSIFGFCTSQPIVVEDLEEETKKAFDYYNDAIDAVKTNDNSKFMMVIREARTLSDAAIDAVESDSFKFAVRRFKREYDFEDDDYIHLSDMLSRFSKGVYEDSSLKMDAFPDLKLAFTGSTNAELFPNCLVISEFFDSFPTFLDTDLKFSGEELLNAINNGVAGYYKLTSHVLTAFIHALSFHGYFKDIKFFTTHIDNVTWDNTAASEICKLFVLRKQTPLSTVLTNSKDYHLYSCLKENETANTEKAEKLSIRLNPNLAKAFADKEFHELKPAYQIKLMEYLMEILMTHDDFMNQFLVPDYTLMEKSTYKELKTKIKELKQINSGLKDKGQKERNATKIREFEKSLFEEDNRRRIAKFRNALKPSAFTLGYDRFNRRYSVFSNSLNYGIFVEEFCQMISNETSDESENEDPLRVELEKLTVESTGTPLPKSIWYRIQTQEEFDAVRAVLDKRGIRERALLDSFLVHCSKVSAALAQWQGPLDLNFGEDESELQFLKDEVVQILRKAEANYFIHFSKNFEDVAEAVEAAKTFAQLRNEIVLNVSGTILPCAYTPMIAGKKFFRIQAWIRFAELCQSVSQMFALLLLLKQEIREDKLFKGNKCKRCTRRFDIAPFKKVIACVLCYSVIHLHCHDDEDEINPDPKKPFWICKNCKKLPKKVEIKEDSDTEEPEPEEPQVIEVNGRTLRATKYRKAKDCEDECSSGTTSRTSSRNSVQESSWKLRSRKPVKYIEYESPLPQKKGQPPLPAPSKAVKEEVQLRYNQFCAEYRIKQSLRVVKFTAFGYSEMTLELLHKYLHQFRNQKQLDTALKSLMVASELHFHNNARGYERVKSYFENFFGLDEIEANNEVAADANPEVGGVKEEAVESISVKDETDDEEVAKVQLDKIQEDAESINSDESADECEEKMEIDHLEEEDDSH